MQVGPRRYLILAEQPEFPLRNSTFEKGIAPYESAAGAHRESTLSNGGVGEWIARRTTARYSARILGLCVASGLSRGPSQRHARSCLLQLGERNG